jgi:hypothetical protein
MVVYRIALIAAQENVIPFVRVSTYNGTETVGYVPSYPPGGGQAFWDGFMPLNPNESLLIDNSGVSNLSVTVFGTAYPLYYSSPAPTAMQLASG